MREIKFRGKRVDNGEWIYGVPYFSEGYWWMLVDDNTRTHEIGTGSYQISYETIGQYTGELIPDTTDRVFWHDIIEQSYINKLNDERIVKRYLISLLHFMLANSKYFDTKIIGNKHDNPELLEV